MFESCGIFVLLGLACFSAALDLGWPEHCIDCDPGISDPVCGCGTFKNYCFFNCAKKREPSIDLYSDGACGFRRFKRAKKYMGLSCNKLGFPKDCKCNMDEVSHNCGCATFINRCFLNCAAAEEKSFHQFSEGVCNIWRMKNNTNHMSNLNRHIRRPRNN